MSGDESWNDVYLQLTHADKGRPLDPTSLETLAMAAYLTGRDRESFQILERAHLAYLDRGETTRAVRSVFWLGVMFMQAGDRARSSGWFARGERLLGDLQETHCPEKGLLLIPEALGALYTGHSSRAQKLFEQAETTGEQYRDVDLIALGRLGHGQALIQLGEVAKGIRLLDETMIIVESGAIIPLVRGIVYCAVIETCCKVWDLERAREWTAVLSRWCDAQPDMTPFRGQCMIRKAEIIQFHGEWEKALEETTQACSLLTLPPGKPAAGEAFYRKAELHRLFGDFEAAEESYQESARRGRNPQPGLALLRLAQSQGDAAETSIRNILSVTKDLNKRAELLPEMVRIMISVHNEKEALQAAEELVVIANRFDAQYLYAKASYCMGVVSLAQGNVHPALEHLQDALQFWRVVNLPYESALARETKGLAYRQLNDQDNATIELTAAKWIFDQLKAKPDIERINRLLDKNRSKDAYGLTLRELQILGHVASGKTNKSVAVELFISKRTVDRHVSNIFNKLGVSSRVEATAFALKHQLLENDH